MALGGDIVKIRDKVWGGGGNKVPVEGIDCDPVSVGGTRNDWQWVGDGGNQVPVEGIDQNGQLYSGTDECSVNLFHDDSVVNETEGCSINRFHDDVVIVGDARMMRVALLLRIMIARLTTELVLLGYVVMINDILQLCQGNQAQNEVREWGVYGATCDGGVEVASPTHGNLRSDGSLNGLDSVEDGGDRIGLRENVMLEGQSSRIQDDETLELQDSTQFHENEPK